MTTEFKVGDEVTISVLRESREWGYNPCPDGTRAIIVGFAEICYGRLCNFGLEPGVYVNEAWVNVRLPDGTEYYEFAGRLALTDRREHGGRLAEFRRVQGERPDSWSHEQFLRALPTTAFWEGDFVRRSGNTGVLQVVGIDYPALGNDQNMTCLAAYRVSSGLRAGWWTYVSEADLTLVKRGPIWLSYHG